MGCCFIVILIIFFSSFIIPTNAHTRGNACTPLNPMNITNCKKLITFGAELAWNINPNNSSHIEILFTLPISPNEAPKWVGWGLHPGLKRPQMVGTRAIIAISLSNGTLTLNKYNITSNTKLGCNLKPLEPSEDFEDIDVVEMMGEVKADRYMSIFARLILRQGFGGYDVTRLNHVWQVGYEADEVAMEPRMHPMALRNVDSTETTNLFTRKGISIGHRRHHLRTVHGILNILGWGTLLPFGVIIARYYRKYPFPCKKRWYFCHVSCQIVGYILGTAGWAIGIWLGNASKEYHFHTHNILAMFIFAFTTLQMIALRLRPMSTDDYRKYWNMYHHFLGYALLALIIVNIFNGIAILKPRKTWLWAYVGILASLASIALCLEIYTWCKFMKAKSGKAAATDPPQSQTSDTAPAVDVPTSPSTTLSHTSDTALVDVPSSPSTTLSHTGDTALVDVPTSPSTTLSHTGDTALVDVPSSPSTTLSHTSDTALVDVPTPPSTTQSHTT